MPPRKQTQNSTTPSDRFGEIGLSHDWLGFFTIRLWLSPDRGHDLKTVRAKLIAWLQERYGLAFHTIPNQTEQDDARRLSAVATKLLMDFDAEAAEFKDARTGDFAVEYQRWNQ